MVAALCPCRAGAAADEGNARFFDQAGGRNDRVGKVGANNRIDLIVFDQTGGCGDCALCGGLVVVNDEIDLTAIDAALGVPLCGGKTRAVFNQFAFNCRSAGQRCPDADTNGICIRGGDGGITVI